MNKKRPRKKHRLSMKARRHIFYCVCIAVIALILIGCVKGCNNEPEVAIDVSASNALPASETIYIGRYDDIVFETWELDEMASIIYLEARNQSAEGQQAVAEVILNRVLADGFPDTITEVLHQGETKGVLQFTTITALESARPTKEQYQAINNALYGDPILPLDVVFFSRGGENQNVWGKIDDHVFCYAYKWE